MMGQYSRAGRKLVKVLNVQHSRGVKGALAPCGTPRVWPPLHCVQTQPLCICNWQISRRRRSAAPSSRKVLRRVRGEKGPNSLIVTFLAEASEPKPQLTVSTTVKNRPRRERTHSWRRGGGEKWKPAEEEEKVYLEVTALFLPLSAWPHFLIACKLTPEE